MLDEPLIPDLPATTGTADALAEAAGTNATSTSRASRIAAWLRLRSPRLTVSPVAAGSSASATSSDVIADWLTA